MIFLSKSARSTIQSELESYPDVETGGILLGWKVGQLWFVRQVVSSGVKCVRTPYHYSMDSHEATERVQAICDCKPSYDVLGIWHKHNHNISPYFSADDMRTNYAYADINSFGAISILATKTESVYLLHAFHFVSRKMPRFQEICGKKHIQIMRGE